MCLDVYIILRFISQITIDFSTTKVGLYNNFSKKNPPLSRGTMTHLLCREAYHIVMKQQVLLDQDNHNQGHRPQPYMSHDQRAH